MSYTIRIRCILVVNDMENELCISPLCPIYNSRYTKKKIIESINDFLKIHSPDRYIFNCFEDNEFNILDENDNFNNTKIIKKFQDNHSRTEIIKIVIYIKDVNIKNKISTFDDVYFEYNKYQNIIEYTNFRFKRYIDVPSIYDLLENICKLNNHVRYGNNHDLYYDNTIIGLKLIIQNINNIDIITLVDKMIQYIWPYVFNQGDLTNYQFAMKCIKLLPILQLIKKLCSRIHGCRGTLTYGKGRLVERPYEEKIYIKIKNKGSYVKDLYIKTMDKYERIGKSYNVATIKNILPVQIAFNKLRSFCSAYNIKLKNYIITIITNKNCNNVSYRLKRILHRFRYIVDDIPYDLYNMEYDNSYRFYYEIKNKEMLLLKLEKLKNESYTECKIKQINKIINILEFTESTFINNYGEIIYYDNSSMQHNKIKLIELRIDKFINDVTKKINNNLYSLTSYHNVIYNNFEKYIEFNKIQNDIYKRFKVREYYRPESSHSSYES